MQYLVSGYGWTHYYDDVTIIAEQSELSKVEVDYITMPGWKSKIAGVTSYNDLPINAKNYIVKLQQLTGIPSELLLLYLQDTTLYRTATRLPPCTTSNNICYYKICEPWHVLNHMIIKILCLVVYVAHAT